MGFEYTCEYILFHVKIKSRGVFGSFVLIVWFFCRDFVIVVERSKAKIWPQSKSSALTRVVNYTRVLFPVCLSKVRKYSSVYVGEIKPVPLFGEFLLSQNHSIFLLFFLIELHIQTTTRVSMWATSTVLFAETQRSTAVAYEKVLVSAFLNGWKNYLRGDEALFYRSKLDCLFEKICRVSGHCRIQSVRHPVYYGAMSQEDVWLYSGLRFSLRASIYSSIRYIHSFWTKNFSFISLFSIFCMYPTFQLTSL